MNDFMLGVLETTRPRRIYAVFTAMLFVSLAVCGLFPALDECSSAFQSVLLAACVLIGIGIAKPDALFVRTKCSNSRLRAKAYAAAAFILLVGALYGLLLVFAASGRQSGFSFLFSDVAYGSSAVHTQQLFFGGSFPVSLCLILLICAATGIFEEGLYRVLAIPTFFFLLTARHAPLGAAEKTKRDNMRFGNAELHKQKNDMYAGNAEPDALRADGLQAACAPRDLFGAFCATSLLFAFMHLSGILQQHGAFGLQAAACVAIRLTQLALFGMCMSYVYAGFGSLWVPALLHAAFDALCFGVPYAFTGDYSLAQEMLNTDMLALLSTSLCLCALVLWLFCAHRQT